jgi:hypothetical protein
MERLAVLLDKAKPILQTAFPAEPSDPSSQHLSGEETSSVFMKP